MWAPWLLLLVALAAAVVAMLSVLVARLSKTQVTVSINLTQKQEKSEFKIEGAEGSKIAEPSSEKAKQSEPDNKAEKEEPVVKGRVVKTSKKGKVDLDSCSHPSLDWQGSSGWEQIAHCKVCKELVVKQRTALGKLLDEKKKKQRGKK